MNEVGGGPSRGRRIGRAVALVESGVVALVLASCGGGDAPTRLKEPDQGDENGIQITVRVRATDDALTIRPRKVPAHFRFKIRLINDTDHQVQFAVIGQHDSIQPKGINTSFEIDGLDPGRLVVKAGGRRATLRVVSGG